ncbi:MAG: amidase [Actinomycetota bacterium]
MTPDEYARLDASDLADAVRAGRATRHEVHEAAQRMHERTDAVIHAVVEWYDEPSHAGDADESGPSGDDVAWPLAGVPILRKDFGSTEAGRLIEMGSRLAAGVTANETSPFVRRLLDAGAQIVGRSAVPEFIQHGTTESQAFGVTRNPLDPTLSTGGSSGGAGAAVAAGVVPMAHASDCAGSIRIPAAACGLVGLKPSRRRVPWPDGGWGGIAEEFVLTRSLRDAALALDVLGDPWRPDLAPLDRPARIALNTEHWAGETVDPTVSAWTEAAADRLRAAGHRVEVVPTPIDDERLMTTWDTCFWRWVARIAEEVSVNTGRPIDGTTCEPITLAAVDAVSRLTVDDVTSAEIEVGRITHDLQSALDGFDAILTPTLGRTFVPLDHVHGEVDTDDYLRRNSELFPYSYLFNVTGWASLAVPVPGGTRRANGVELPGSVQLSGPLGSERRLLALAAAL